MNANVKIEEIAPLGDFVLTSYTRDFGAIESKFPKLNADFKAEFEAKLALVKDLESSLVLTEQQKGVTASLYAEANELSKELNFLKVYVKDAGLNFGVVLPLKQDLQNGNIEGALLKMEAVKQFVVTHKTALMEEGMPAEFDVVLTNYKLSMTTKNNLQNEILNNRKQLTEVNKVHYDELKDMIKKICSKGKLVFTKTVYENEYVVTKVAQRMRAAKRTA